METRPFPHPTDPPVPAAPGTRLAPAGWAVVFTLGVLAMCQTLVPSGPYDQDAAPRVVDERGPLASDEAQTIALFEERQASVVHVATSEIHQRRGFFSNVLQEVPRGTGSGFVWDADGTIVTNYHVAMANEGGKRVVTLSDGSRYDAEFLGADPANDLAVLRIDAPRAMLSPVPLGRSEDLRVGQKALAIGNPFGFDWTLTVGVISGLERTIASIAQNEIRGVIQTDAAVNPGNSGGPLLDSAGRLIGVNTAIYSPSGASAGLGFAVPVDTVNRVVPEILASGRPSRTGIGILMGPDQAAQRLGVRGVIVAEVVEGGSAARAGLRGVRETPTGIELGDVIVGVDGRPIGRRQDLVTALAGRAPGETAVFEVARAGQRVAVDIELMKLEE